MALVATGLRQGLVKSLGVDLGIGRHGLKVDRGT